MFNNIFSLWPFIAYTECPGKVLECLVGRDEEEASQGTSFERCFGTSRKGTFTLYDLNSQATV